MNVFAPNAIRYIAVINVLCFGKFVAAGVKLKITDLLAKNHFHLDVLGTKPPVTNCYKHQYEIHACNTKLKITGPTPQEPAYNVIKLLKIR